VIIHAGQRECIQGRGVVHGGSYIRGKKGGLMEKREVEGYSVWDGAGWAGCVLVYSPQASRKEIYGAK
jgi:hypothetical protein